MNTSGDRLKALLRECHLTASDFAANRRVTPQHVNNWFKRGIPMARLDEIAELLCVHSRWLRTGEGNKHPGLGDSHDEMAPFLAPEQHKPAASLEVEVPFYSEALHPDGSGRTRVMHIPGCTVRLSCSVLEAMDVSPDHALCVAMIGNHMAHKIQDGSTVAIDRSLTHIVDGELYALEQDGMLRIKYVYRLPNNGLRLRSHNPLESADEVFSAGEVQAQQIRILGWVFWWSTLNRRRPQVPYTLEE
ncbi:S24 family peptidase [Pseudomonas sp. MS-1(2024)]|jgi:phage repressor protein C with HTH and peptisase S24 domain|uniref:LexA family transcriptional regulator n=1 Tax=Pseudomonas sp. MS-1(2024) TaxID=3112251 RepID=UPI001054D65D|nr:S24 family peptidase [Pseudomonas sp. MS-1(2024)]MEC4169717.1 S24 family peptidase [Pseudomonas sp. MS-1(2024)]